MVCLELHTPDDGTLEEGSLNAALATAGNIVPTFLILSLHLRLDNLGYKVEDFVASVLHATKKMLPL